ncbi:MAG: hypothetical protein AAAC48_29415 [Phyllobacterium sp.]|uniref:hypothetical protein n=1 Tax=Phyllobacterium sp. TaxID=1871046 RepID=UPI0030F1E81C
MITASVEVLRNYPEIALFMTLAIGHVIGKIQLGGHALGLVTGSLFAGHADPRARHRANVPAIMIGGAKLALSNSVGTLLAGLLFGWLQSPYPWLIGKAREPTRMFLVNFGLAGFVAIAGVFCICIPPTVGILFGKCVLRMNPVLLLGGVEGAQTMTAATVAVHQVPVIGFTVP